ncbi:hypothetical protein BC828DRAFT_372002 [Blastocladiella britannica]|nr:hypothetical protein BC828DRAFT_372002 [Blastocladiella britannica]
MDLNLTLLKTHGYRRGLSVAFASAHSIVFASENTLVWADLLTNDSELIVTADGPIGALAGIPSCDAYVSRARPTTSAAGITTAGGNIPGLEPLHRDGSNKKRVAGGWAANNDHGQEKDEESARDSGGAGEDETDISGDDSAVIAFCESGSPAIQLLGRMPGAMRLGSCMIRDSRNVPVIHLAFLPRASPGSAARILASVHDLPDLTVTLWDTLARAPLCSLSHAVADIPRWLVAVPDTRNARATTSNGPPHTAGSTAAASASNGVDGTPGVARTCLLVASADTMTVISVRETFHGYQLTSTDLPPIVHTASFSGIDDELCTVSGAPVYVQQSSDSTSTAAVLAPVRAGHALGIVSRTGDEWADEETESWTDWYSSMMPPSTSSSFAEPVPADDYTNNLPWGTTPIAGVFPSHASESVWVVVTCTGDVYWVDMPRHQMLTHSRTLTGGEFGGGERSDSEPLTILASARAPVSISTSSLANRDAAGTLLAAAVHSDIGAADPVATAWVAPRGTHVVVSVRGRMWSVSAPSGLFPDKQLAATPNDPGTPVMLATHHFSGGGNAVQDAPIAMATLSALDCALLISRNGAIAPILLSDTSPGPLSVAKRDAMDPTPVPGLAALGPISCAVGIEGTHMVLVGCAQGIAMLEWCGNDLPPTIVRSMALPRAPIKIEIEYQTSLVCVLFKSESEVDAAAGTGSASYASNQRPGSRVSGNAATSLSSSDPALAAAWILDLDTLQRHSHVTLDLPIVPDCSWDAVTEQSVALLVLAREPLDAHSASGRRIDPVAPSTTVTTALFICAVARESDPRKAGLAAVSPATTTISAVVRIPDTVLAFGMPAAPPAAATRLICCLTADAAFKAYALSATSTAIAAPALVTAAHTKMHGARVVLVGGAAVTVAGDGVVCVRSVRDLDRAMRSVAHAAPVRAVSVSSSRIVTLGANGLVRVWKWKVADDGGHVAEGWAETKQRAAEAMAQLATQRGQEVSPEQKSMAATIKGKVDALAAKLRSLVAENATVAKDNEQLTPDQLLVNAAHAAELMDQGTQAVAEARSAILQLNAKHEAEVELIRKEKWEPMVVPGKIVSGLAIQGLAVSNYAVRATPAATTRARQRILVQRRVRMGLEQTSGASTVAALSSSFAGGSPNGVATSPTSDTAPDDNDATAAGIAAGVTEQPLSPWQALMYPSTRLTTPECIRAQIVMLEAHADELQAAFNARFDASITAKSETLAKVAEKYDRMRGVYDELGQPPPPAIAAASSAFELGDGEVPERIFIVDDSELAGVPKYLTEEEEARLAEQRRQDAERAKNSSDDSRARALSDMMGGVLVKDEKASAIPSAQAVPKPEVLESNKPKLEWTEDEKRAVKEYEKKVSTIKEEQEKARKALESELRKLEAGVEELRAGFDARVFTLLEDKMETDAQVHMALLRALMLARQLVASRQNDDELSRLNARATIIKAQRASAVSELPDIKLAVDSQREVHDLAVKRDRELERFAKKELMAPVIAGAQLSLPNETMWKLYRKRDGDGHAPLSNADFIAGMTTAQWNYLNELRSRKLQAEAEIRSALLKLRHSQKLAEALVGQAEQLKAEADEVTRITVNLERDIYAARYDALDLFILKQGQVEVPPAPVVTDYSTSVLIHRRQVEDLNVEIRRLGQTKLDALKEMRNYRRGILALDWETKVLEFQAGDVLLKTKDLQLLRVSKSMQEFLRSGDETAAAKQNGNLERQLEYADAAFEHKLADRRKTVRALKKQARDKASTNQALGSQIAQLQSTVATRETIRRAASVPSTAAASSSLPSTPRAPGSPPRTASPARPVVSRLPLGALSKKPPHRLTTGSRDDSLLAEIAQKRQLADLARAQAQDIAVLAAEVHRWRLKTFPAFPSVPVHTAPGGQQYLEQQQKQQRALAAGNRGDGRGAI